MRGRSLLGGRRMPLRICAVSMSSSGEGAAEGITVHAELFGCLALVALMLRQHFEDVALFELTNGLRVGDAGTVASA